MEDDQISTSAKISSFILTLIAVPALFVFTCVPVGLFAMNAPGLWPGNNFTYLIYGYSGLFALFASVIAIRTKNSGMRWGIATASALILLADAFFLG